MEKTKNIAKNYIYNLMYQIIIIILPIITTPYLSRVLGVEKIGIYGYTISIITYFTLFASAGIAKYGQREIAYVQNDIISRSKIFWELNIIRAITTIITSIIFYILFCIHGEYSLYYRILILELMAIILDISWFFQGIEDFKKVVIRNAMIKIVSLFLIFIFVKKPSHLSRYFIIYVISNFLGNGILWFKISKYIDKVKVELKNLKKHIKPIFGLFIPQIAASIYTILDKTMLGIMIDDISEVGFYEQAQKIVKIALTFVTTLSIVMMPRISSTYAQGNKGKIKKYMNDSFRFNWFLGIPIMFGILTISEKLIPWFLGAGYEKTVILINFMSPVVIFIAFSTTIGSQYLISIKKQNVHTIAVIFGAISNIFLNIILIPKFESIGAIIATVIAEFIITMIEIIYVVINKYIDIRDIFSNIFKYLTSGILMYISVSFLSRSISLGVVTTIIQVMLGIGIYFGILIILKDSFVIKIINKLKRKEN